MLVGRRRRLLNYLQRSDLEGYRALSRSSACASASRLSIIAPARRRRSSRCGARTASDVHARGPARQDRRSSSSTRSPSARSAPTSSRSTRRRSASSRADGRRDLRRLVRRRPSRRRRSARSSASRSRSSRTSSPRARPRGPSAPTSSRPGISNRALVIIGADGVVAWSWVGEHPGDLPGVNLVFDGLAAAQGS